jgi:ubiquinone/menaquinone biosynthesis C-methylase UbiE
MTIEKTKKFETTPEPLKNSVGKVTMYDKIHLKMISIIHDGLYRLFVNPNRLLTAAGLKSGQNALEVGCGPGFFTIPAAQMLGKNGHLTTLDINPAAVVRVRKQVEIRGLQNVDVMLGDASKTRLPEKSIDVAFLFGVIHSLKDLDSVLHEMNRILKEKGVLSVQKSSWTEKNLLSHITRGGLFRFVGKKARIYRFVKTLDEKGIPHVQLTIED